MLKTAGASDVFHRPVLGFMPARTHGRACFWNYWSVPENCGVIRLFGRGISNFYLETVLLTVSPRFFSKLSFCTVF